MMIILALSAPGNCRQCNMPPLIVGPAYTYGMLIVRPGASSGKGPSKVKVTSMQTVDDKMRTDVRYGVPLRVSTEGLMS